MNEYMNPKYNNECNDMDVCHSMTYNKCDNKPNNNT